MNKKQTIAYVAAESGGHIIPGLTLARQWQQKNEQGHILFFTGSSPLEKKIMQQANVDLEVVYCALAKRKIMALPLLAWQLLFIFFTSFFRFLFQRPEAVISTGGALAVPVCFAARFLSVPIFVYELNMIPGKANKLLFRFATTIYIVFPQTKDYCRTRRKDFSSRCIVADYPLRFKASDKINDRHALISYVNDKLAAMHDPYLFDQTRKTIFILGGSQGSVLLNNLIEQYMQTNPVGASTIQIIHQTGKSDAERIKNFYARLAIPALTFSYDDNVKFYYQCADLIVCRAGAGTLFEIAFFQKPCIVIPLIASSTTHQKDNALAMAQLHPKLFLVLEQAAVIESSKLFFDQIDKMLGVL